MTKLVRVGLASLLIVVLLAACAAPAYTPDVSVVATREAAEYTRATERGETAWRIGIVFVSVILLVVIGLVVALSRVGYRVQAAKATKSDAEARRLELVSMGDGKAYDLRHKTMIATGAQAASQLPPVVPAEALPKTMPVNKYAAFVQQAAHYHPEKWNGKTIPRFDKMGMTSNKEWIEITGVLDREGLIDKSHGSVTTITEDQTLGWLYNLLTTSPIEQ